jgi:hypothetical protein
MQVVLNILFMAFFMVAASALILIPFMLYGLDLRSSGWTAGHVAMFGAIIASTDAASVSAVLRAGAWGLGDAACYGSCWLPCMRARRWPL